MSQPDQDLESPYSEAQEDGSGVRTIYPVQMGFQQMFGQDWSTTSPQNQPGYVAPEGDDVDIPKDAPVDAAQLELDLGLHPSGSAGATTPVTATPDLTVAAPPQEPLTQPGLSLPATPVAKVQSGKAKSSGE